MIPSVFRRALPLILIASVAGAQEFELDLSEEKPAATPPEYRPTLGVISVKAADKEDVSASRARQFEAELLKQLQQGDLLQTVIEPSAVKQQLGADFAAADACTDYACLEGVAKKLKVHRLVRLTVQKQGAGSLVTMYGWDPGFNEVLVVSQDSGEKAEKAFLGVAGKSQATKDREFLKKMQGFISQVQKTLAIPNGKIVVDNADPSAIVTVDGTEGGVGSVEVVVQRGIRTVKVTSAGYKPFEQTVTVEQAKSVEVKVSLVAIPIDPVVVQKPVETQGGGIFTKPGLYLTIVGAIAVGTGIALGQSAQAVKNKLQAGGDPVAVSRADAKNAPTNALLANILVGAGSAAVAGGVTWIIVTLPPPPPKATKTGTGEPTESSPAPTGAFLSVGGSF